MHDLNTTSIHKAIVALKHGKTVLVHLPKPNGGTHTLMLNKIIPFVHMDDEEVHYIAKTDSNNVLLTKVHSNNDERLPIFESVNFGRFEP